MEQKDSTVGEVENKELDHKIADTTEKTAAEEVASAPEPATDEKRPGFFRRHKALWVIPGILLAVIVLILIFIEPIVHFCVVKILPGVIGAPVKLESVDIRLMDGYFRLDDLRVADSQGLNSEQFIKVDQATLLLKEGDLTVKDIAIANPEGFREKNIMTLKNLKVDLETDTLSEPKLEIEELTVDGLDFYFESSLALTTGKDFKLTGKNNVKALQEYIEKLFKTTDEKTGEKSTRKIQIDKLNLTNINVHIHFDIDEKSLLAAYAKNWLTNEAKIPIDQKITIPLVDIKLENLGKGDQGITADDIIVVIIDKLSQESEIAWKNYVQKVIKEQQERAIKKAREKVMEKAREKARKEIPILNILK